MLNYLLRRFLLMPVTLFFIILVNFVIINLAPGDPVNVTEVTQQGAVKREDSSIAFNSDDRYLQFREFYGLTLPILFNTWPFTSLEFVEKTLWQLVHRKDAPTSVEEMNFKDYEAMRISFGDRARFIMPHLLFIAENPKEDMTTRRMAVRFFIRGGIRQGFTGPNINESERDFNRKIAKENLLLGTLFLSPSDSQEKIDRKLSQLKEWYKANEAFYAFNPTFKQKMGMFFFETRFYRYFSRLLQLDFGT